MKEKNIFLIYVVLFIASFAPFSRFFTENPLLTLAWILGVMVAFLILTVMIYLGGHFNAPGMEE